MPFEAKHVTLAQYLNTKAYVCGSAFSAFVVLVPDEISTRRPCSTAGSDVFGSKHVWLVEISVHR